MIVVLFDPTAASDAVDVRAASDILGFIMETIPRIMDQGDQLSIFQLGYRTYEAARVARVMVPYGKEWWEGSTFPIEERACAPEGALLGFDKGQDGSDLARTISYMLNRQLVYHDPNNSRGESPYSKDVVYEGLWHATLDFNADCSKYQHCFLIVIDDLTTWTKVAPKNVSIDLSNVQVFIVMPGCENINSYECVVRQEYWNWEFAEFGAKTVRYFAGTALNGELLEFLTGALE